MNWGAIATGIFYGVLLFWLGGIVVFLLLMIIFSAIQVQPPDYMWIPSLIIGFLLVFAVLWSSRKKPRESQISGTNKKRGRDKKIT